MPKSVFSDGYAVLLRALVDARKTAGITQAQLAGRLRKPQSFVSKIENGERRLDLVELVVVVRALGVDEEKFVSGVVKALPGDLMIAPVGGA